MQIKCEKCEQLISYEGTAPKFCSECGSAISTVVGKTTEFSGPSAAPESSGGMDDRTVTALKPDSELDSFADTIPPDGTRPISPEHAEKFNLETIGPYRLLGKLGQGGMGTVYEAVHQETGRHVALKLLSPNFGGTDEMVQRFKRESEIAASINHPRSTFVYESGEHQGQLYITMELMPGGTLRDVVESEGPLPVARAVDYILDIIDGLLVAHNAGIVHRDLKPSNSFVDTDGRIKVGDFGLAKSFMADSSLTQTGTFMGTPQYAAPEQIRNENIDERTDIYALGGTLFYLLSGRAPFVGNAAQVITSIATDVPSRVSEFAKQVPKPLVALIAQTLEKDPARRPFNLNMVRDVLLQYSTRGAMAGDPGRRMAAFFLDSVVVVVLVGIVSSFTSSAILILCSMLRLEMDPSLLGLIINFPIAVGYYAIFESLYGRTLGKWLLGLRVVNQNSESPKFIQAVLRSLLIPGIWILFGSIVSFYLVDHTNMSSWSEIIGMIFKSQVTGILSWLGLIPFVVMAKKENGYRCLHGVWSGTRVVRLAGDLESRLIDDCPVTVPTKIESAPTIGEFEILGQFNSSESGESVYLAKDEKLNRPLWVFSGFETAPISVERSQLARPSRLRVISQGEQQGKYWYATESVPGVPLKSIFSEGDSDWQAVCPLIRDIAHELMVSEDEDSSPKELSPNQFWLDHTGRVRIFDHELLRQPNNSKENSPADEICSPTLRAVDSVFEAFMASNDHPVELFNVRQELRERQDDPGIFGWLVNRLNEIIEQPSAWGPIDRGGMIAISIFVEYAMVVMATFFTSYLVVGSGLSSFLQATTIAAVGCAAIGLMACVLNGGLAIRLSNVSVRLNRDKTEASKLRSAVRAIFGWLPLIIWLTIMMFAAQDQAPKDGSFQMDASLDLNNVSPSMTIGAFACLLVVAIGVLVAIANPVRGIQDFLAGTRLMRK